MPLLVSPPVRYIQQNLTSVAIAELRCLSRLIELRADGNGITDIEGLEGMRCLAKLSLKKNRISRVDFADCEW